MKSIFGGVIIKSYLYVCDNIITEVSKEFVELTGFSMEELLGKSLLNLGDMVKINSQILLDNIDINYCGFIFTKSLEAREVDISITKEQESNEKVYTFIEKSNFRLEDKLMFVEQTFIDNIIGAAIYSAPNLILLKANQRYLNFMDSTFNKDENSIGSPIGEIVPRFVGSQTEVIWNTVLETQKTSYIKEVEFDMFASGTTYWDLTKTPIFESGEMKYIFATSTQVTEKVLERQQREELENKLKSQNELLEAVIENMYDALAIYDKKGNIILMNAECRKLYPQLKIGVKSNVVHNGFQYFDLDNNILNIENLPTRRVFKGERIRNERIIIKHTDWTQYTEINATPIFDDENNLKSAVVSHHDISELIKNQKKIKQQQEQLLRAEKEKIEVLQKTLVMKDEFFINISHELKTPLNVIYSTVQLFNMYCSKGSLDEMRESIIKYIDSIKKNSYRLFKLINNIVDLSKIEAGFLELCLSNNNIVEVVEEIVMSVTDYIDSKGLNIIFDTDIEENIIACDPEKIERIVLNLISNAVKFSNKGDEIFVEVKDKNDFIQISVKDNGIGIEENYLNMIFDRYKQVDKSLSRNAEGTGIGLSLVKSIVELHGGSISVESEYGKGSKFIVVLPSKKVSQENMQFSNIMRNRDESVQVEFSDICT